MDIVPRSTMSGEWSRAAAGAAIALLTVFMTSFASAQSVADFYRGKTVTILIGHPPAAPMTCMPGSRRPSGEIHSRASPGLGAIQAGRCRRRGRAVPVRLRPEGRHAARPFRRDHRAHPTGPARDRQMENAGVRLSRIVRERERGIHDAQGFPAKTIDELRHIETKVGCSSRLSQSYLNPSILKAYRGFKFHIVCGYPGSMDSRWCSPAAKWT